MSTGSERQSETIQRHRVLVLAPVGRDAALACGVLARENLNAEICSDVPDLVSKLRAGAGTAIIADEALNKSFPLLCNWVETQPAWSDFPFIVLAGSKAPQERMEERFALVRPLGNITLLERPLRSLTLISVVRAALRARTRQYEVEHYIQEVRQAEADRAQAQVREEAAQARIEMLNHVGGILSAEFNLDALLPAILDAGLGLSGADIGIFFLEGVLEGVRKFALRCSSGIPPAEASRLLGDHALLDGGQFANKKLLRCSGFMDTVRTGEDWIHGAAAKLGLANCIALPVTSRPGSVVGIVLFGRRAAEPFSGRDENLVSSLASQAAIAIDNARLFNMAEQERRRLEAARQVLQHSNEELQQFAYVASHDLKEPLRTIASFTQLLVRHTAAQQDPESARFAGYIVDGVYRMNSLIQGLLQYSSSGARRSIPDQPASAEAVLAQSVFALSASIKESGAEITYDPLPKIWMDDQSLGLLLQNLIGNAIKYRSEKPPRIHVSSEATNGDWIFSVRDNGIGISPEYRERIFGIFKRLHGREVPGTGIGLAICQRIVQWHGGKIWVESCPDGGSVFRFKVPRERHRIQREMAELAAMSSMGTS